MQTARKKKISSVLLLICLSVAIGILLYPSFTDWLSRYLQVVNIGKYTSDYLGLSAEEIRQLKEEAILYNEKIYQKQKQHAFAYEGEKYEDEEYDKILQVSPSRNFMGYIEIPSLTLKLPIAHGTKAKDLLTQAGHMHGTSVPIGGTNTHSVIAGHTGLRSADLFTGLDRLKKGDVFYIHVLNEIHVYTVDQIKTVLPEKCNQDLGIVDGQDFVTLYTCTPYGINSHRLLVRGIRTYPDLTPDSMDGDVANLNSARLKALLIALLLALIPFGILGTGLYFILRDKQRIMQKKLWRKAQKQKQIAKNRHKPNKL